MWLNLFMVAVGQGMVHIVAVSFYVVQLQCRAVFIDGIIQMWFSVGSAGSGQYVTDSVLVSVA